MTLRGTAKNIGSLNVSKFSAVPEQYNVPKSRLTSCGFKQFRKVRVAEILGVFEFEDTYGYQFISHMQPQASNISLSSDKARAKRANSVGVRTREQHA